MTKPAPKNLEVVGKWRVTPNLVRLSLTGHSLVDFPPDYEGGYVKLHVPDGHDGRVPRSFTVREFDHVARRLDLEMVSHGDSGPAAIWANQAQTGDRVDVSGPGACKLINPEADWFLMAGDMSALPALRVNAARLPEDAVGHIVVEIIDEADKDALVAPHGVEIHWIVNPEPESPNSMLEDTVMALPWRDGQVSAWIAGEFSASRALRQYLRHERDVAKDFMYVSCYWKIGVTDEGMKAAKRADPEPW